MSDPPRLLAQRSELGYTDRHSLAVQMEPEAVREEIQVEFSNHSRSLFEIARAEEVAKAETRSRCNRLRELEWEARRKAIDPTRALAQIERGMLMLESMVRGSIFRGTA